MDSLLLSRLLPPSSSLRRMKPSFSSLHRPSTPTRLLPPSTVSSSKCVIRRSLRLPPAAAMTGALTSNSTPMADPEPLLSVGTGGPTNMPPPTFTRSSSRCTISLKTSSAAYTVGEFMTKKEDLRVVKPTTTVDEALETLVDYRITGFPVIDDDWKLVGVVSDYDLLALDSISGSGRNDTSLFPEADSTWKTFNEIQKLLSKTNGKVIGEVMTPAPLVVRETTNLEDVARLLLETKYRRLPVVDSDGKLVGIITRGNVVRAALQIKRAIEKMNQL